MRGTPPSYSRWPQLSPSVDQEEKQGEGNLRGSEEAPLHPAPAEELDAWNINVSPPFKIFQEELLCDCVDLFNIVMTLSSMSKIWKGTNEIISAILARVVREGFLEAVTLSRTD